VAQQGWQVARALGIADRSIEPLIDLLEHCQFQGPRALFWHRVNRANTLEDLTH
jgi:hypothetical protein